MSLIVISCQTLAESFDSARGRVLCSITKYSVTYCSRPEAASDVISGKFVRPSILNKVVKFGDPRLNRSRAIRPKFVRDGILFFDVVFRDNCRPEVLAGEYGINVRVKFGDSMLNRFTHFCPAFNCILQPAGSSL